VVSAAPPKEPETPFATSGEFEATGVELLSHRSRRAAMPRTVRRETNQRLFREVNDRIAELSLDFGEPGPGSFFCECGRVGCREMVEVPFEVYGRVRDDADLYVVLPGHEDPAHEQTVEDHTVFVIVRALVREASPA
jgi:hypothetical protein